MTAKRSRPAGGEPAGGKVSVATATESQCDTHAALRAADAAPWFNELAWQQALERAIDSGRAFSVDELQAARDLPDLQNALGGIVLRYSRAGLITRLGYRPSNRSTRAGGVVAIWRKAGAA